MPNMMPNKTSLGKCTNIYSLEKAIIVATRYVTKPNFLLYRNTEVAAANAQAECVEGQE